MSELSSILNIAKEKYAKSDTGVKTVSLLKIQAAGGTNIPKWPGKNVSCISRDTAVEAAQLKHLIRRQATSFFFFSDVFRSKGYHLNIISIHVIILTCSKRKGSVMTYSAIFLQTVIFTAASCSLMTVLQN